MKKYIYGLVALLSCELWVTPIALASSDTLLMGVFPRRNAKLTMKMFTPMADYLSKKTGKKVKAVTAKNFPTFWKNVKNGRYDLVHYNQLHYVSSHKDFGYKVIASNEEFGTSKISSAFIVRKDSGINSVKDLKGKKILFGGGKKAFVSYVSNVVTLNKAGLSKKDYVTKFAKNPPNATIATFLKQGDAAGVGNIGIKVPILKKKGVDVSELKLVGVGEPFPHLPWAVNKRTSEADAIALQKAMLSLNESAEGKKILKKAGMTGIHKAVDSDFKSSREKIKEFQEIK